MRRWRPREAALTGAEAAWRDALRERDGLARDRAAERAALDALVREAALPEPGALAAARAARDRLWDAVRGGGAAAAVAFERALRQADAIADTLIAHAAQAAEADGAAVGASTTWRHGSRPPRPAGRGGVGRCGYGARRRWRRWPRRPARRPARCRRRCASF